MPGKDPLLSVVGPLRDGEVRRRVRPERRRVAVIGLDVVGYSLMMGRDEEETHQRIGRALVRVSRHIQNARGEIFSFSGDGLMALLPSAPEALRCAFRIQTEARNLNRRISPERRIRFRIGMNYGDILLQDGRAGGDAVNIAARLEQIAEPDGICITQAVYEQVRQFRGHSFASLGEQLLKNIRQPVLVYRVGSKGSAVTGQTLLQVPAMRDPRPSVVVLPLRDIGSGPENQYFAEGIVEDIVLSLTGLQDLVVIARSSAIAFAERQADPREVGRLLGVNYVVSGRLRRSTTLLRVSVQLADAETGVMLWAETSETPPGDLFEVQDWIVQRIVVGIAPHIREQELQRALRRRPENMTAYDLMLQALHVFGQMKRDSFPQARQFLERAMQADPSFPMPVAWAALWHAIRVGQAWSEDPDRDARTGAELADRAVALDPRVALGLAVQGHLRSFLFHDYDAALASFEQALAAGPNNAIAVILSALTLAYVGRTNEAIKRAEYALRLSPLDRSLFLYHNVLAWAHYAGGTYQDAVKWARLSAAEAPEFTANLRALIASLVGMNDIKEARQIAARMIELEPDFSMERYAATRQPFRDPAVRVRLLAHLRVAGLPG